VGRCLGRGGYGEVYRAIMQSPSGLSTEVALKVLLEDVEVTSDAIARLREEGRLLGRINHPVVVRAYDLARIDGRIGLVTEYVEGDDLDRCFHGPDRLPPRPLLTAMGQVASALDAALNTPGPDGQPLGIVHRDLKPPNVRIGRHGQVKLLDFGIARFQTTDPITRELSQIVVGSVPYLAPERFERASLPAGDVFGLGCCLFEGLAGERFHPDGSLGGVSSLAIDQDAFARHRDRRLARLSAPADLVDLVAACLSFDPDLRPPAREVSERCEALAESVPGPSLRRFCAEREWKEPAGAPGALEGRTIAEGELGLPAPKPAAAELPMLRPAPAATIDPASFADDAPGPPALAPGLPVGVRLVAEEPRIVAVDSIDLRRAIAPAAIPARAGRGGSWLAGLGLVGCTALIAAGTLGIAVAVLIGALSLR
jgi:hypothetical protein